MSDALLDDANSGEPESQYRVALQYAHGRGRKTNLRQAAIWARRAADQGHAMAQAYLAHAYENGNGLKRNPKRAIAWLRRAADSEVVWAQLNLGIAYWNGEAVDENDEEAVRLFQAVADCDEASPQEKGTAQWYLAFAYRKGLGVEKDVQMAVQLLSESARNGDRDAMYQLVFCYSRGIGVEIDRRTALEYLQGAADLGHPDAQVGLGLEILSSAGKAREESEALNLIQKAAAQGHARAQLVLGRVLTGSFGVHLENPREAFEWISSAAEQDLPEALCMLGSFYLDGYGVDRDVGIALDYLHRAAERDNAAAQFKLYSCTVDFNEEEAIGWLLKAAEQDHPQALTMAATMYALGKLGPNGTVLPEPDIALRDLAKHEEYMRRAAELGDQVAHVFMGLNAKGRRSFREAAEWFSKAAAIENEFARAQLAEVYLTRDLAREHFEKAINILEALAEEGSDYGGRAYAMAGVLLAEGELLPRDLAGSVLYFARAATRGDAVGSVLLGDACEFGRGLPRNIREAIRWYRHAAKCSEGEGYGEEVVADVERLNGPTFPGIGALALVEWLRHEIVHDDSERTLLDLLNEAKTTELPLVDYLIGDVLESCGRVSGVDEAAEAFRRAAMRGHREAQYRLARLLLTESSSPGEVDEAVCLLEEAIHQDLADATRLLGICFLEGKSVPLDPAQGEHLLKRAALQGDSEAQLILGRGYLEGRGLIQDPAEAYIWLNLAAAFGEKEAQGLRDAVAGDLPQKDLRKSQSTSTEIFRGIIDERKSASERYQTMVEEAAPTLDDETDD